MAFFTMGVFSSGPVDVLRWTILYCGAVLCIVGCLSATLISVHYKPGTRTLTPVIHTQTQNFSSSPLRGQN